MRVTSIGLGRPVGLYLPSLTVSLIENGCIELSNSVRIVVVLVRSDCSRSIFLVPLGHSAKPNRTTLNLLAESGLEPEAGAGLVDGSEEVVGN